MIAHEMPPQSPTKAPSPPSPPIPALPGEPGGATRAQQAGQDAANAAQQAANDAQRVADEAQRIADQGGGPVIADAPPPPPPFTTTTGFPVNPEALLEAAIPIVGMSLAMMVVLFIGWPLARAFARRQDRKIELGAGTARELQPQIRQLQESLDAMAIELERISESQRFQAKLLAERAGPEALKRI